MNDNYQKVIKNTRGFTLLEMIVVIVIIGVLMTLTAVIYGGVQSNARNVSVLSDVDKMESLQTNYGLKTNTSGKSYYSGDGPDTELGFTASDGNVITVTVNSTDYCIRGYNPTSSYSNVQNAYIRESSPGVCAVLVAVTAPDAPITSVALIGADVVATINPVVCSGSGTVQYSMEGRIDDGLWSGWSAWSDTAPSDSQLAEEGVKYGYHSRARCYVNTTYYSDYAVGGESTYTHPVNDPSSPNIAVNYSGGVLATITPVTCMAGSPQYSIDNRLNDGSWSGYTAWSSSTSASQTASEGVKYGYRAKARCYVNSTSYSTGVDGSESTYIHPISTVPSAPSVSSTSNVWPNTVYSWTTPSCPSGTSTRFQYDFTTSYGYDSGWVSTSSTSVSLSTSTAAQTYTLNVHAQCYTAFTSGSWGSSGATSYYRPNLVIAYAIGAGGDGYSPFCDGCGAGGGGGGGAYAQSSNIFLNNGTNLSVTVGTSGTTSNFGNIVVAAGGQNCGSGNSYGVGGQAGSSTGSIRYSGGNGGIRSNSASTGHSAGGGGAAGPNGNGTTAANATGDGAGAGASNGGNANNNTTPGGAGGGCTGCNGGAGGSAWNGGGGGGGAGNNASGGSPGNYGGGGGGGEYGRGVGGNGVVVIYYPNGSMSASGGSISADGSYTYHTFTGSGTFSVY